MRWPPLGIVRESRRNNRAILRNHLRGHFSPFRLTARVYQCPRDLQLILVLETTMYFLHMETKGRASGKDRFKSISIRERSSGEGRPPWLKKRRKKIKLQVTHAPLPRLGAFRLAVHVASCYASSSSKKKERSSKEILFSLLWRV